MSLAGGLEARGLGEAGELEAARANARAGGPTSERDKDLLTRYGCLSGTRSSFCRRLDGPAADSRIVEGTQTDRKPSAVLSRSYKNTSKRNSN
ncbi:MAG: hypothetical protein SH859_09635 [Hyphomicrobium aestuarii]|nr:hypothetical protein [Hyphomicrobium aestuarii]